MTEGNYTLLSGGGGGDVLGEIKAPEVDGTQEDVILYLVQIAGDVQGHNG